MQITSRRSFIKGAGVAAGLTVAGATAASAVADEATKPRPSTNNPAWLGEEPVVEGDIEEISCEVLVIGAGTGGLECGSFLVDKGLAPLIIEKNDDVSTLRNDWGAIDSRYQQEQGTVLDNAAIVNYHVMQCSGRFDRRLQKIWAKESGAAIDFMGSVLEQYGAVMLHEGGYEPEAGLTTIPKFPTGHSGHFTMSDYDDGKSILKQFILDNGGTFSFGTRFVKFEYEGKKVAAAIAQDVATQAFVRIVAEKGIVLASGGYQNNPDMLDALQPHTTPLYGMQIGSTVEGEGIKACLWMGASFDDCHSTMLFDRMGVAPTDYGNDWTNMAFINIGSQPWLKVNLRGERFFDESGLYDYAPHACAEQPGRMCCSIMDANYWQNITQFETVGCSRTYPFPNGAPNDGMYDYKDGDYEAAVTAMIEGAVESGVIVKADTLEELAEGLGIPADTFTATVERYNELAKAGYDDDFYKDPYRLIALETAPFYGFRNISFSLSTLDGIRIDTHMHPIDADCEPFEGLYLVGDCSGSYFAHSYPNLCTGYAHGRTCTFARRVAAQIAGEDVEDYTVMAKE